MADWREAIQRTDEYGNPIPAIDEYGRPIVRPEQYDQFCRPVNEGGSTAPPYHSTNYSVFYGSVPESGTGQQQMHRGVYDTTTTPGGGRGAGGFGAFEEQQLREDRGRSTGGKGGTNENVPTGQEQRGLGRRFSSGY